MKRAAMMAVLLTGFGAGFLAGTKSAPKTEGVRISQLANGWAEYSWDEPTFAGIKTRSMLVKTERLP